VWGDAIGPAGWQGAQKQAKGSANAPSVQGRIHRRAPQQNGGYRPSSSLSVFIQYRRLKHGHPQLNPYWEKLEIAMESDPPVIVPKGRDEKEYFEGLRASIRECATPAIQVTAAVMEPGFEGKELGSAIAGYLLAKSLDPVGYWLVYQPDENDYSCFWGLDESHLGA
jgi:hypothetical protein